MRKVNLHKLINLLGILFMGAALLTSCTKEGPMGPAGKDGTNGTNGTNGINGTDGTEACGVCHATSNIASKQAQMHVALHASGTAWFEGSRNGCAPCHSANGFLDVVKNNPPINKYNASATALEPNPIGCRTCHKVHTSYTAADWTFTFTGAVNCITDTTSVSSPKQINLQPGSNLCIKCHQARIVAQMDFKNAPTGNYTKITSFRWGPHYGTQGSIVGAKGAFEIAGAEPYASSTHHTSTASCADCHMATMSGEAGGHTFLVRSESGSLLTTGCLTCHTTQTAATMTSKANSTQAEIKQLLVDLGAKLDVKHFLARDPAHEIIPGTGYSGYVNLYDASGNPTGYYKNPNDGNRALAVTNLEAAAIANFMFVLRDKSLGVHNYAYTKALLKNSIAALP